MPDPKVAERSAWWLALVGAGGIVLGAAVTGGFSYLSHKGDLDAKMIELSVGILRAPPTPETTPLREWAIDVIDKRAQFKFNAVQRAALLKRELPFKGGAFSWGDFSSDFQGAEKGSLLRPPGVLPPTQPTPR